jgi:hypothetical protein
MTKIDERWVVQGVVSAALKDDEGSCDLKNYVIFSSVVKHLKWINNNMKHSVN